MRQELKPPEWGNTDGSGRTLCRHKSSINFREAQGQTDKDLSSFIKPQSKQSELLPRKRSWVHISKKNRARDLKIFKTVEEGNRVLKRKGKRGRLRSIQAENETVDEKEAVSKITVTRCQNSEGGEDCLMKGGRSTTETLQATKEETWHQADTLLGDQTTRPFPACCSRLHRKASFSARYKIGGLIGKGGCGVVFDGIRKCDKRRVAIKYVPKTDKYQYLRLSKDTGPIPKEVALMQLLSCPPKCCYVLQLLEWIEKPDHYILVLEQPFPCQDMLDFIARSGGHFEESTAQAFMNQVVLAVKYCRDRGVLHRDIKLENILVQTDTLKIKLIDFGCGDLLQDTVYNTFAGTKFYCPPEWMLDGEYLGGPATIWSLGVLLFELVCGWMPFRNKKEIIAGHLHFKDSISEKCRDLICWCLHQDPRKRPVLEQILKHDWMKISVRCQQGTAKS